VKILVIDDSMLEIKMHQALLSETKDCEAVCYTNPVEALNWSKTNEVDILIVDYMMPEMNGLDFLRLFRMEPDKAEIPVLIVTALIEKDVRYKALELGANDFLNKPVDIAEFQARIKNMITLRKNQKELANRAEWLASEVRKATMVLNRLIENLPEGVVLLDDQKQILLANPSGENFLNVLSNAVNSNALESIDGKSLDRYLNFDSVRKWHEVKINDPVQYFKVAVQLVDQDDGKSGYIAVIIDETREAEIRLKAQNQDRLAVMGQFAASIAHDFNNILFIISGKAEVMLIDKNISEKVREGVTTIMNQADRGSRLIRQILDFSRSAIAEKITIDLLPLLQETAAMLECTLRKDIHIRLEHQASEDYIVNVDPSRFQQIVTNLVINSRDAMPQDGEITLKLANCFFRDGKDVPFEDMREGKWVTFSCADNGTGISAEILPHIFEPFFSTKKSNMGTGLGLAQVYGLVKQHDGFIDVKTTLNQGTTFVIYLPV